MGVRASGINSALDNDRGINKAYDFQVPEGVHACFLSHLTPSRSGHDLRCVAEEIGLKK